MNPSNPPPPSLRVDAVVQWTRCPQCGAPAEIRRRDVLDSTAGPVEHAGVVCLVRHTFLLPTAMLAPGSG